MLSLNLESATETQFASVPSHSCYLSEGLVTSKERSTSGIWTLSSRSEKRVQIVQLTSSILLTVNI